jgi:hypothetical protein
MRSSRTRYEGYFTSVGNLVAGRADMEITQGEKHWQHDTSVGTRSAVWLLGAVVRNDLRDQRSVLLSFFVHMCSVCAHLAHEDNDRSLKGAEANIFTQGEKGHLGMG